MNSDGVTRRRGGGGVEGDGTWEFITERGGWLYVRDLNDAEVLSELREECQ